MATLKPNPSKSKKFDDTNNLYIEGDNLDVLKILQRSYAGRVKMIYLDPPYNTGREFVYNDDYQETEEDYLQESGQMDNLG
ncbi:site-specific DNA-methyltransferase, partial [Staphylococcus epidermidis]